MLLGPQFRFCTVHVHDAAIDSRNVDRSDGVARATSNNESEEDQWTCQDNLLGGNYAKCEGDRVKRRVDVVRKRLGAVERRVVQLKRPGRRVACLCLPLNDSGSTARPIRGGGDGQRMCQRNEDKECAACWLSASEGCSSHAHATPT